MIKKLIKRLILRENSSSNEKIKYLRKIGISIGNGTTIFDSKNTFIDETRPWLITIGDNVQITKFFVLIVHLIEENQIAKQVLHLVVVRN